MSYKTRGELEAEREQILKDMSKLCSEQKCVENLTIPSYFKNSEFSNLNITLICTFL